MLSYGIPTVSTTQFPLAHTELGANQQAGPYTDAYHWSKYAYMHIYFVIPFTLPITVLTSQQLHTKARRVTGYRACKLKDLET